MNLHSLPKMPVMMGMMLGIMIPLMLHGGETGPVALGVFVALHIAVIMAAAIAVRFVLPTAVRARLSGVIKAHRPRLSHLPFALGGAAIGVVGLCLSCLAIWSLSA